MKESLDVSAQLTQVQEVDMTRVVNLRAKAKQSFQQANGVKLTYLPFIATAVTEGLKQRPKLNAEYNQDEQQITYHDAEHLAIAVDTDKGLLVPVINDAGDLSIAGLAKRISDVGERTRDGKISPDELSEGNLHHHQHRIGGGAVRHSDHQSAAGGHPGHRHHREAAQSGRRRRRQ